MKLSGLKIILLIVFAITTTVSYSTNYYVDGVKGNNSNTGLSFDKALKTLQKAADKTIAGDTVFVMNGTYVKDNSWNSDVVAETSSGTADKWIVWTNFTGHKPLITFDCWRAFNIQGSYIEINGFTIKGNNANVTLQQALNQPKSCANPSGSYDARFNGSAISADGRNGARFHHLTVKNCTTFDCGAAGISFIQSDYITVENNIVYNNSWYTLWSTSGINLWQNWNSDGNTGVKNIIRNNICYMNRQYVPAIAFNCGFTDGNGIIIDDSENSQNGSTLGSYKGRTLIENNIVYKNGGSGIHTYKSKHVDIINNTAYLNNQSAELNDGQIFPNSSDDIRIFNNILVAPANKRINSNYNNGKSIVYDYNLHFGGNAVALTGSHLVKGDPMFADAANNDFRLQLGSPAINKGIDSLASSGAPVFDFDRNARPLGAGFEIGAYEFNNTTEANDLKLNKENSIFSVYPNPAENRVNVDFTASQKEKIKIDIINLPGQTVLTNTGFPVKNGLNTITIDLEIPKGTYLIMLSNGVEKHTKKLIIK